MLYIWRDKGQLNDDPGSSVIFEWTVHPPRQGGYRRVIFVLAIVGIPLGLLKTLESPVWAFFATVFLLGATSAYWLPTRFSIDHDAILVQRWFWKRRVEFSNLKRIDHDPNGLFVSPFAVRSRLDGHRGLLLMEPPHRDEVEQFIRARIAPHPEGRS